MVVPVVKLAMPLIARSEPGVEVPMPTLPLISIVSAVAEEVAKVAGEEVARYRRPPAFLNVQWLEEAEPSERASWGALEEASWRRKRGVVVPMPVYPTLLV